MINYLDLDEMVTRLELVGRILLGRHSYKAPKRWEQEGDVLKIFDWDWDPSAECVMATLRASHPEQHLVVFGPVTWTSLENRNRLKEYNAQQLRLLGADIDHEVMDVLRVCS